MCTKDRVHREALHVISGELGGEDMRRTGRRLIQERAADNQHEAGRRSKRSEPAGRQTPANVATDAGRRSVSGRAVETRRGRAVTSQNRRRVLVTEQRLALVHQLADGLLGGDAGATRRAPAEMFFEDLTIGGSELAV